MARLTSLLTVFLISACGETPVDVSSSLPSEEFCRAREVVDVVDGGAGRWEGERVTITVKSIEPGSKTEDFLGEPKKWRGVVADLEVCARNENYLMDTNFRVCAESEMVTDPQIGPQKVWEWTLPMDVQFREPVFDQWAEISAGECQAGYLTFVETWSGDPESEQAPVPVAILFEAQAENGDIERVAWRFR